MSDLGNGVTPVIEARGLVKRYGHVTALDGADFELYDGEILAKDERGLMPFHWITLPANGGNPSVTISHRPVTDEELLTLWYWLIATSDTAITLTAGQV